MSILMTLACINTDVLIIGDSQAGRWTWGGALEEEFVECGADVSRYSFPGWSNERLWSFVQGEENSERYGIFPGHINQYEIVILIGGDNDIPSDRSEHVVSMINHFESTGASVYYSILPPATEIADMDRAARVFPYLQGSEDTRYWFNDGLYEEKMIYRETLRSIIYHLTDAHVLDIVEIAEENGIDIPKFPDGIHIPYSFAQELAGNLIPFN